jgi:hypothetical protein
MWIQLVFKRNVTAYPSNILQHAYTAHNKKYDHSVLNGVTICEESNIRTRLSYVIRAFPTPLYISVQFYYQTFH